LVAAVGFQRDGIVVGIQNPMVAMAWHIFGISGDDFDRYKAADE
jgi:hypothetical protein